MPFIDRETQRELVNVLISIPRINQLGSGNRDFLLEGLPQDAAHALKRDPHPRFDLNTMVTEVVKWGQLDDGEWAIFILIQNALELARGTQQGRELGKLLEKLKAEDEKKHEVDFAIITALDIECQAIVHRLEDHRSESFERTDIRTYHRGKVPIADSDGAYEIVAVLLPDVGNVSAALAAADVIRQFNPKYILMVGIAGGVPQDDLELGDVVVADWIVEYEYTKVTDQESEPRYHVWPVSSFLLGRVRNFWDMQWTTDVGWERPKESRRLVPKCFVGNIATGSKIVASHQFREKLVARLPKLHAVEMEAGGVIMAAFYRPQPVNCLIVRGISDWADEDKNVDQTKGWRKYAANSTAAYVMAFLRSGPVKPRGGDDPS